MKFSAILPAILLLPAALAQTPDLDFLIHQTDGMAFPEMLSQYLRSQAARRRLVSPPDNPAFRARFIELLGGLPERTPLNAKVTGVIDREGYRIEKIIFESQPGFFVTANLYVPTTGRPPFPAILFPIGHEPGAKAYPVWQQILANFARRGYVALTWDQLGQGERIQHWDPALGDSKAAGSTIEHTVLGIQCLITGDALARYTIWDGIRALDYLLSRPEVDKNRVGVTGNSGGGTHTAYLAALDPRIQVAAPSCFITSWKRLLETIGPQDAEQCIPGFLGAGFEHVDLVRAFAPKPYLILSAIRDFFSIEGSRLTHAAAAEAWASAPEKLSRAEADAGHGYTATHRQAAYAWFDRWLRRTTGPEAEDPSPNASPEDLACTPTGQVATALGGETVYTMNRERARALKTPTTPSAEAVRRRIGWREEAAPPAVRLYGSERRGKLLIRKMLYESEPGISIPAVLVSAAASAPQPGVLFVSAQGKGSAWSEIEALATAGATVLAIDARGFGETRPAGATKGGRWQEWFGDYDSAMTAVLLGSSLVGQRAYDIQRGYHLLAASPGVDRHRIYGAARGNAAPALLHAAAAGVPFARLLLDGMLPSYRSVTEAPIHRNTFESVVPGALRDYDLPGLIALLAPNPVIVVDPISPMGIALPKAAATAEFKGIANVRVLTRVIEEPMASAYLRLLD